MMVEKSVGVVVVEEEEEGAAVEFNQMQNSHSGCWPAGMHSCFSYVTGRPLHPKLPPNPPVIS